MGRRSAVSDGVVDSLASFTQRDYETEVERLGDALERLAATVRQRGRATESLRNPGSLDYMGAAQDVLKEMDWAVANMNTYQIVRKAFAAHEAARDALT